MILLNYLGLVQVLRPHSNMANLEVWDYYLEENLAHGPPYDLELVNKETQQHSSEMAFGDDNLEHSGRVTINNCYDNVGLKMPHAFSSYLQVLSLLYCVTSSSKTLHNILNFLISSSFCKSNKKRLTLC